MRRLSQGPKTGSAAQVNEDTVIRYMPLRTGTKPWRWYPDANLIVLCSSLDAAGQDAALSDLQDHWRRECLRVVPNDAAADNHVIDPATCPQATVPMTQLPAGLLTAER